MLATVEFTTASELVAKHIGEMTLEINARE
jgi:hypothetical protein